MKGGTRRWLLEGPAPGLGRAAVRALEAGFDLEPVQGGGVRDVVPELGLVLARLLGLRMDLGLDVSLVPGLCKLRGAGEELVAGPGQDVRERWDEIRG